MVFLVIVYKALPDLCHIQFAACGDDTSQVAINDLDYEGRDSLKITFFFINFFASNKQYSFPSLSYFTS